MLTLVVDSIEMFDPKSNTFSTLDGGILQLEHSLVSLSKWESKFEKSFISTPERSNDEMLAYIKFMTLNEVEPHIYNGLTSEHYKEIADYINAPMTATTITEPPGSKGRPQKKEIITAEIIYYWMVSHTIPFECQYWHLNRLITLIRVCNEKNKKPEKMSRKDLMNKHRSLNAQRRAAAQQR